MASYDDEGLLPINNQTHFVEDFHQDSESRDMGDKQHDNPSPIPIPTNGLTVLTAMVFLVGEMAGSGILALPLALESMGFIGILIFLLFACVSAYTGKLLGICWLIVQERYVEYRGHVRHPYPVIGQVTYGKVARVIVSFSNNFTMFGGSVVFLILASQNIRDLLKNMFGAHMHFCYIQLIVACLLVPLSWLGTPKDFWPVAVGAALATSVACVVLLAAMIKDKLGPLSDVPLIHGKQDFLGFFQALGIILFAYGGHPAFPTFQTDMKEPHKFGKVVYVSYLIITLMYLPVSLTGFLVYGKRIEDNVLLSISPGPLLYVVQILITCHLFCAFVIIISPVVQEIEEFFKMRKEFSWRRMISRTATVAFALFVSESVPRFGSLLSLIGGSSMVILVCICPPVFYLKLRAMDGDWPKVHVPLHTKVVLFEIIGVGVIVAIFSTYASIKSLTAPGSFALPCYVNMSAAQG